MDLISNVDAYLSIARESYSEMQRCFDKDRRPKNDGSGGWIICFDPERRSFKSAIICITFCGMVQDALIYIELTKKYGRDQASKIDKNCNKAADRLSKLGLVDQELFRLAERFRILRNELVHEKAIDIADMNSESFRTAQSGAKESMVYLDFLMNSLSKS